MKKISIFLLLFVLVVNLKATDLVANSPQNEVVEFENLSENYDYNSNTILETSIEKENPTKKMGTETKALDLVDPCTNCRIITIECWCGWSGQAQYCDNCYHGPSVLDYSLAVCCQACDCE